MLFLKLHGAMPIGLKIGSDNCGQILFYEDPAHIKPFSEKFALYKDKFVPWADHSNAMHQYFRMFGPASPIFPFLFGFNVIVMG